MNPGQFKSGFAALQSLELSLAVCITPMLIVVFTESQLFILHNTCEHGYSLGSFTCMMLFLMLKQQCLSTEAQAAGFC